MILLTPQEQLELFISYRSVVIDEQTDIQPDWVSRKFSTGRVMRCVISPDNDVTIKQVVGSHTP